MNKIAVIPARSGSKGLRDKNIINLCGKPLIAYSIEAAIEANIFNKVIVTTDSQRYGEIAMAYGAEVVYRGENLSNDTVSTFYVIEDVLKKINEKIDYFALLQPTSPMRTAEHIREAAEMFEKKYNLFDFLVSVKEAECSSILVKPIDNDESLKYFDSDFSNYRRQEFQEYSPNGALFFGKVDAYLLQKHFFGKKALAYKMSLIDSVDIDNELDYELAKICMMKKLMR
jgi:CMP-N-acetylneuraminic acid synthetase